MEMTLAELDKKQNEVLAEIKKLNSSLSFMSFMLNKTQKEMRQVREGHCEIADMFGNCQCRVCLERNAGIDHSDANKTWN